MNRACNEITGFSELLHRFERNISILGRSKRTFENYSRHVAALVLHFGALPTELHPEQVKDYLFELQQRSNSPSQSYFKHTVYGLRFLLKTENLPYDYLHLPSIPKEKKLPVILSREEIWATVSQKTRFATIKDRYSYRMGTAIPNPDLKPETAINYEVNYTAKFFERLTFQTALFYSTITDAILSVSIVQPGKAQMQNFGKAQYSGIELQADYSILENLSLNVNYTYIERKNMTSPKVHFTDVPGTKVMGTLEYQPLKVLRLIANAEFNSSRYSTSYGTAVADYTLLNFYASGRILKNFSLDAGLNNILDRNYSLVEGFPEEGRNFFVTLRFFN